MALLIDIGHDGWMPEEDVRDAVRAHLPDADIRLRGDLGRASDITMLACSELRADLPARLPNLALVQKLGAGVETIVDNPALPPHARVARLKPMEPAREIAEWALSYMLRDQRQHIHYQAAQAAADWAPVAPRETRKTRAAVLGLGHIGATTARLLRDVGFITSGWSSSPKQIDGVTCLHGPDALPDLLAEQDYVVAILPSTAGTRDLFDAAMLARMKPGACLLNAGRGDLIDETALRQALDAGTPGHAVLDVTRTEPLPTDHPLWAHPGVTLTPHVSGWHLGDAIDDVAENYRRLMAGEPLLHEVDRSKGY
ncbi:MAG: glyoxylate/hydroxypyruvate reductase A [Rhodobacteraceae bacterium]|nr:glyoxylate/hydroxypyruvate reductase A [Paracoccaceae bacterium]